MLPPFFSLSNCMLREGNILVFCWPCQTYQLPDSQPSEPAGDTTAMHLLHLLWVPLALHAAPQRLSELPEYLLSDRLLGTSHPAGASLGSSRTWLMVMYAPRIYATVGNEPCVAGVENSLPLTSLMCYFWFTTSVRRALGSPGHASLGQT